MADENTEKLGAEPGNKTEEKVEVKTEDTKGAELKDVKADPSNAGEPWHKDPRFKNDLGLLKTAKSLMEKNSLESVDDLVDLIESGKKVKGKQIDLDRIDEIKAKADTLDKYQAYWAQEEEKKKRADEDPEETIKRLESKLNEKDTREKQREAERQSREDAAKAIQGYDREVKDLISEMEIPKEQSSFVMKLCGVGNPFNDIDITDKKAIKRVVSQLTKEKEEYDQTVIKNYLKGKGEIPKVGSSGTGAEKDKPKIYLKDARKIFLERMRGSTGG